MALGKEALQAFYLTPTVEAVPDAIQTIDEFLALQRTMEARQLFNLILGNQIFFHLGEEVRKELVKKIPIFDAERKVTVRTIPQKPEPKDVRPAVKLSEEKPSVNRILRLFPKNLYFQDDIDTALTTIGALLKNDYLCEASMCLDILSRSELMTRASRLQQASFSEFLMEVRKCYDPNQQQSKTLQEALHRVTNLVAAKNTAEAYLHAMHALANNESPNTKGVAELEAIVLTLNPAKRSKNKIPPAPNRGITSVKSVDTPPPNSTVTAEPPQVLDPENVTTERMRNSARVDPLPREKPVLPETLTEFLKVRIGAEASAKFRNALTRIAPNLDRLSQLDAKQRNVAIPQLLQETPPAIRDELVILLEEKVLAGDKKKRKRKES